MKIQTRPAYDIGVAFARQGKTGNPFDPHTANGAVNPNWAAFKRGHADGLEALQMLEIQKHMIDEEMRDVS